MSSSAFARKESSSRREKRRKTSKNEKEASSYQRIRELGVPFPKRSRKSTNEIGRYTRKNDRGHDGSYNSRYFDSIITYKDEGKNDNRKCISDRFDSYEYELHENFDAMHLNKKEAFLRVLKESPKRVKQSIKSSAIVGGSLGLLGTEGSNDNTRLFVGNLFNKVENNDIERLLEPYGSVVEVRRYEKHAIVTVKCSKETAEKAIKELDHNHWMDNWIRVKFDKFETSKEESWKKKLNKFIMPLYAKYEHCDRGQKEVEESDIGYESNSTSTCALIEMNQCKVIDSKSKRGLSEYLKTIRHNHCVEVVDSLLKAKESGDLEIDKTTGLVPVIKGTQITSSTKDPRTPIDYADIDF